MEQGTQLQQCLLSYTKLTICRTIAGDWAFRLPFLLQMFPALLVGGGIHFFPFSPRWLAMRGRNNDSLHSLAKLRRVEAADPKVQAEWKGILAEVHAQQEIDRRDTGASTNIFVVELKQWAQLFSPKYFKRTLIALMIPFFQQCKTRTLGGLRTD